MHDILWLKQACILLAFGCALIGAVPYLRDIIHHRTKPHLFTWLVWGLIGFIATSAQIWDHAGIGAWAMVFSTIKCLLVSALALRYGEKRITRSDWISLAACLAAIPLWMATGNPLASVLLLFAIETIAFYPTFRKTWAKPFEETLWAYNISSLQFIFGLIALENYTFITMIGGVSLIVSNAVFVIYALIRRRIILNGKAQ